MNKLVVYNHGKDSTPWGEKALAFAKIAKRNGYDFESPDYRQLPNPDARVEKLLTFDFSTYTEIIIIGSSMGAYVATLAAEALPIAGLFLLAPAFYLPGYQRTEFHAKVNTWVYHGWQDDIVPPENAWKFCSLHRARLLMLNSDHRLLDQLPLLTSEFEQFLNSPLTAN